jgi:hypothetical protein
MPAQPVNARQAPQQIDARMLRNCHDLVLLSERHRFMRQFSKAEITIADLILLLRERFQALYIDGPDFARLRISKFGVLTC